MKNKLKKNQNKIIAAGFLLVLIVISAVFFDAYYDLNDDVLMKDILAGNYTGTPESRNIQMLWGISAFISLLYRIMRPLPWYGLFLCICQWGALYAIEARSLRLCHGIKKQLLVGLAETLIFAALMWNHFVFLQYTITCTMLAAAASFLLLTTDSKLLVKEFIVANIPSVLLIGLAFLIRSEMLLLVSPLVGVSGFLKWSYEEKPFAKENFQKYLTICFAMVFMLVFGQISHNIAYGSKEWKAFTELFNQRTELYDYQSIPPYESHKDFYERIGLTKEEQVLFENYNFGMDDKIDEQIMGEMATYAKSVNSKKTPFANRLKDKTKEYIYRITHGPNSVGCDYPFNVFALLLYGANLLGIIYVKGENGKTTKVRKAFYMGLRLLLVFACRTSLWMYILLGNRVPDRISHSLYFMEIIVLGGLFFSLMQKNISGKTVPAYQFFIILCATLFSLMLIPGKYMDIEKESVERERVNDSYNELYTYLKSHKESFYFIDVYSSVSYSEKMFYRVDNTFDNFDIMGGWASKSPLTKKKYAYAGLDSMEEALLKDNVYFVKKKDEDMNWISDYYASFGVTTEESLSIALNKEFEIWSIKKINP